MGKPYLTYAQDVVEGKVVTGELVKLACARFLRFLDDERYEFRSEEVDRVIRFISHIRHYTGSHAGKPFILAPWQQFCVAGIYGFYRRSDNTRLTKSVYIEIARKNGKTAFASALALVGLIADNEMNAEVDLAANSREQARIAFTMCKNFARGLNPKGNRIKPYRNNIEFPETLSTLNVFSADSSRLDGFNAHYALLDEFHAAKDGQLRDVLQSSQGMRDNPINIIITTAGFDKGGPCYETRTVCTEVLHGIKENDSQFSLIFSLDESDDWTDENVWIKANPNLGITVRRQFLREQVIKAQNNPSEEVGVKTKNFNVWCDAETVWIPDQYISASSKDFRLTDFKGMDAWVGVDLSSTSDITAIGVMIPDGEKYHFYARYYLPESALKEHRQKIMYGEWRRRGLITITPGNVTDYDFILNDLKELSRILNIQRVAYDSWNASQFTIYAEEAGLPMEPYSQALGNFNRPVKEFERLIKGGRVVLHNNEINRFCFKNVQLKFDHNGNAKPTKASGGSSRYGGLGEDLRKIDGVIAMLQPLGVYLTSPAYDNFY